MNHKPTPDKPVPESTDSASRNRQPVPEPKVVKGSRRLAREKVMQLISAQDVSGISWRENFPHVFPFEYRIHDSQQPERLLSPEEVERLEADFPIEWDEETKRFAIELLEHNDHNDELAMVLIEKFSQNWEVGRIAHIDRVILKLAIAELIGFPEIPPKVTINEAIEIVKKYSTEKSSTFVNGILDSVLAELQITGKLFKTGRGLINDSVRK